VAPNASLIGMLALRSSGGVRRGAAASAMCNDVVIARSSALARLPLANAARLLDLYRRCAGRGRRVGVVWRCYSRYASLLASSVLAFLHLSLVLAR
jgi:hypothetical protein